MSRVIFLNMALLSCLLGGLWPATSHSQQPPHLHVIVVADTKATKIGPGCLADLTMVRNFFSEPSNISPKQVTIREFCRHNDQFHQKYLLDYLNKIPIHSSTGVLVYYSGHGEFHSHAGHVSNIPGFNKGRLPNEEIIYTLMKKKPQPRLVVVISDACNDTPPALRPKIPPPPKNCQKLVEDLFLRSTGVVNINGCSEGELAFGPELGGIFTNAFLKTLTYPIDTLEKHPEAIPDGFVTWREFFPHLVKATQAKFSHIYRKKPPRGPNGETQKTQIPQAYRLPFYDEHHSTFPNKDMKPKYHLGLAIDTYVLGLAVDDFIPNGKKNPEGVSIAYVAPDSPFDKKFQPNDVITKIDRFPVKDRANYFSLMSELSRVTNPLKITFHILRNGKKKQVSIQLTPSDCKPQGVIVRSVSPNSPASNVFRAHDILFKINGKTVRNHFDFVGLIDFSPQAVCTLEFRRPGQPTQTKNIQLKERERMERIGN